MRGVDLAVPCYEYGHFLRECVQSVLQQKNVEVRVLILDDASPDDTPAIAAALVAEDARVSYRRHAINRGHIATYNEGLDWAEADYSLLLSADDVLTPGALDRALFLMEKCPEMGVTFGESILTSDPSAEKYDPPAQYPCLQFSPASWFEKFCRSSKNIVGHHASTALARTAVQKKCGHFRETLPHSADLEMALRMGLHGRIGMVRAKQAYYRQHAAAMHLRFPGVLDLRQRKAAFDSFFREHGRQVPNAVELQQMANHRLAQEATTNAQQAFAAAAPEAGRDLLRFAWETDPSTRPQTIPAWANPGAAGADSDSQN